MQKKCKCIWKHCNGKPTHFYEGRALCNVHWKIIAREFNLNPKIKGVYMTNRDKWLAYTDDLSSPQNFIDWSWRFVISAALQRRVSFGGDPKSGHRPVYPNAYIILVGKAGVGKGIVINPAIDLLKFHKRKDFTTLHQKSTDSEKTLIASIDKTDLDDAEATTQKLRHGGEKIDPPLFPYAPDATTYEKLVEDMSNAFRRINFTTTDSQGQPKMDIYGHCSLFFGLPELASLFRKRTDDTVNYLLGLYDCPLDYEYKTKTKGQDRVRRGCLNLLAGTTPEFMTSVFDQQLIDQGFSSRTFFIYAAKNRKPSKLPEPITPEQQLYRNDLLNHIKELAKLYGEVKAAPGVRDRVNKWWENEQETYLHDNTISPKLTPYIARKLIHVTKVAMQEHFSESLDMEIQWDSFERAIDILGKEEKNMHVALTFDGENPLGKVSDKVIEYLKYRKNVKKVDLVAEFWKNLPQGVKSMDEVLDYLIGQGQVEMVSVTNELTNKEQIEYRII
jgi:hypothetical protein